MIGIRTRATEVDHRRAILAGGHPFAPANLRSLCKRHHSQKTILLDGQHRPSGKSLIVTGPDGFPIHREGPANGIPQTNRTSPFRTRRR